MNLVGSFAAAGTNIITFWYHIASTDALATESSMDHTNADATDGFEPLSRQIRLPCHCHKSTLLGPFTTTDVVTVTKLFSK
eukprot:g41343.t1